ncbi:ABC transporter ATP-binding protein [Nodosilinea sp. LEGE 07088]|uniref:ABC transporter ATP-binding protein n=1 Tax=Nodosilinea sp. LEGE 07088 TaxID=2777968 RepID=UPI0018808E8B|nr:ABC transporter ATP-binding protein [Nodosilinea sp. LEGE 07088]MBE9136065.1 ABC transporter ATP-binding protein [Nodosilinea sp. LEGE 07088]
MARSQLQKLGTYLWPHWQKAALGVVALFIVNLVGVWIPLLIRNGIDELQVTFSFNRVMYYSLLVLLLASVMWVIRMVSRITLFGVGRQVEFDLKQRIFQHLLSLEPAYFGRNTAGELISRATSDVDNIRRLLGFAILSLANTLFAYALTVPVMLSISVRLTLISLIVYPVMLVLVQSFSHRLRSQQLEVQERISDLSDLIQEDMSGIALIKIYAQEDNERRAFGRLNTNLLTANLTLARTRNTLFPLLGGLASISLLVILATGAGAIADGALTVGDFVALLLYVERLVFPTALLGFTITAYQRGEVSINRVEEILDAEPEVQTSPSAIPLPIEQVQGTLEARHLSYNYTDSKVPALDAVSFKISPGEQIAIVGPIGSGKSTLANALPRLLDIGPGQLYLDGYDVTELPLADLRRAIAYVPQDSFLFSTSINNNIRYGSPLLEFLEVQHAAKQAQMDEEIQNFPQHYDTIVGERGITLSGGQRQRTALARALVVDAPILVLDDALSSVDNRTATAILNALSEGTQQKTVLFISHQMSAAATADRIFVMDEGRIVQQGHHRDLVQQPGLYRNLWEQHQLESILQ